MGLPMRLCAYMHSARVTSTHVLSSPRHPPAPLPIGIARIGACGALHAPSPPPCVVPTHPPPSPRTGAHTRAHACAYAS